MIIQQPAQQLPPVTIKTLLKRGVREASGVGPVKEADQRLELLTARGKRITASRLARASGGRRPLRGCTIATSAARRAGLHRPRRKVRHNGCRDRRSRWPPPWSTKDMSNADFDTRHTSPRTLQPAAKPAANGPKHRPQRARTAQPRGDRLPPAPRPQPRGRGDSPKTPYLQGIHCQFSPTRRSLEKSRTHAALYRSRREAAVASWTNDSSAVPLLRARGLRSWDLSRGAAPLTRACC